MSPPATSVEYRGSMSYDDRPQTATSSYCRYTSVHFVSSSAPNFNPGEPLASSSGNTGGEGYGGFKSGCSSSFSGLGQNGSARPSRPKPRLAKVRRGGFGGRSSNSTPSFNGHSSFNPFLSRSSGEPDEDDIPRARDPPGCAEKSSSSSQSAQSGFVFGADIGFFGKHSDSYWKETKFERTEGFESENACNIPGAAVGGSSNEAREHAGGANQSGLDEIQRLYDGGSLGSCSSVSDSGSGIKESCNREENEETVESGDNGENVEFVMKKDFVFGTGGFPECATRKMKDTRFNRNKRGVTSRGSKIRAKHNPRVNLEETGNRGFVFGSSGDTNTTSSVFSNIEVPEHIVDQPLNKDFVFAAAKPKACGIPAGEVKFTDKSGDVSGNAKRIPQPKTRPEVHLSEQMKNLHLKADLFGKRASNDENEVFIFRGLSEDSDASTSKSSAAQENVDGKVFKSGLSDGSRFQSTSENVPVYDVGDQVTSQFFSSGISGNEIPQMGKDDDPLAGTPQGASNIPSFSSKCSLDGLEKNSDFKPFSFVGNIHDGVKKKVDRGVKPKVPKNTKSSKTRRKAMPKNVAGQTSVEDHSSGQNNPQVNVDSTDCYSPMDFSPSGVYPATNVYQQDHSTASRPTSFEETRSSFSALGVSSDKCDGNPAPPLATFREMPFQPSDRPDVSSGDAGDSFNSSHHDFDGTPFHFSSDVGNKTEKFKFTASTPGQGQQSSIKRQQKKYRMKTGHVSAAMSNDGSSLCSTPVFDSLKAANGHISTSKGRDKKKSVTDQKEPSSPYMSAVEKSCDKWRIRGNEAYKNGELSKAEGFYTWGINCVPSGEEAISSSLEPLVICYSNRAATKMALGRVREALQDCLMAVSLDPQFLKGQVRAANCHLMLGELEEAVEKFEKCLQSTGAICLDRQFVLSASDGLQKTQKVRNHIHHVVELLKCGTSEAAITALDLIEAGLSSSLYSEKLLELKAEAFLVLQRYDEAIRMCHQTHDFANKNFPNHVNVTVWRDRLLAKCYFYQGKFDAALDLLDKQESKLGDSLGVLITTIHDLLKHKNAGNEAFQAGKHRDAIEHYTSAILRSTESRPFAAVCFGNRAAAYQALGLIVDAIADCSLAIALDENYAKAVSRRATLHEMIRDYKQAVSDLERLVSILENKSRERTKESRSRNEKELRQTMTRLSSIEVEAKREIPLDMYMILGVSKSDTEAEIKKAYRKAALKHHPDKAAKSLGRGENDDGRLWMEIADSVRKDSDRLFKMIGEAYAVLSDPEKRSEYDLKEEFRNIPRESKSSRSASFRRQQSDVYGSYGGRGPSYPFEKSSNRRRYWWGD